MIIKHWPAQTNPPDSAGMMIQVSSAEALRLIKSMSAQMLEGNANAGRHEFAATRDGEAVYFSVSVMPPATERTGNA